MKTVQQLTGLKSNYLIVVNFSGFKQIVNEVDGVYVDVDRRYFNDNSSGEQYAAINLQPGYQRLTGGAALDYARFRHTDSDFHRSARQQAFVKALKQQISSNFSITKLPGIINVITDTVEVGRGGKKKLDLGTVLGYARFLYELPAGHFFQSNIEVEQISPTDFELQPTEGADRRRRSRTSSTRMSTPPRKRRRLRRAGNRRGPRRRSHRMCRSSC